MDLTRIKSLVSGIRENAVEMTVAEATAGLQLPEDKPVWANVWKIKAGSPRRSIGPISFAFTAKLISREEYSAAAIELAAEGQPESSLIPLDWDSIFDGITAVQERFLPVTGISWNQADLICMHLGGRLPAELEWELLYCEWLQQVDSPVQFWEGMESILSSYNGQTDKYGSQAIKPQVMMVDALQETKNLSGPQMLPGLFCEYCADYFDFDLYKQSSAFPVGKSPAKTTEAPYYSRSVRGEWQSFESPDPAHRWYADPGVRNPRATFRCCWSAFADWR